MRNTSPGGWSAQTQLDQIQYLLPDFKYSAFAPATHGFEDKDPEGVAILSKYPIMEVTSYNYTLLKTDPDTNPRIALRALIDLPGIGPTDFFVIHLSYDKTTQCRNINELRKFLYSFDRGGPQILLGDFNA